MIEDWEWIELVPQFSGKEGQDVEFFLEVFEGIANVAKWSEIKRAMVLKSRLIGETHILLMKNTEFRNTNNMEYIKNTMMKQFGVSCNVLQNQNNLHESKSKPETSVTKLNSETVYGDRNTREIVNIKNREFCSGCNKSGHSLDICWQKTNKQNNYGENNYMNRRNDFRNYRSKGVRERYTDNNERYANSKQKSFSPRQSQPRKLRKKKCLYEIEEGIFCETPYPKPFDGLPLSTYTNHNNADDNQNLNEQKYIQENTSPETTHISIQRIAESFIHREQFREQKLKGKENNDNEQTDFEEEFIKIQNEARAIELKFDMKYKNYQLIPKFAQNDNKECNEIKIIEFIPGYTRESIKQNFDGNQVNDNTVENYENNRIIEDTENEMKIGISEKESIITQNKKRIIVEKRAENEFHANKCLSVQKIQIPNIKNENEIIYRNKDKGAKEMQNVDEKKYTQENNTSDKSQIQIQITDNTLITREHHRGQKRKYEANFNGKSISESTPSENRGETKIKGFNCRFTRESNKVNFEWSQISDNTVEKYKNNKLIDDTVKESKIGTKKTKIRKCNFGFMRDKNKQNFECNQVKDSVENYENNKTIEDKENELKTVTSKEKKSMLTKNKEIIIVEEFAKNVKDEKKYIRSQKLKSGHSNECLSVQHVKIQNDPNEIIQSSISEDKGNKGVQSQRVKVKFEIKCGKKLQKENEIFQVQKTPKCKDSRNSRKIQNVQFSNEKKTNWTNQNKNRDQKVSAEKINKGKYKEYFTQRIKWLNQLKIQSSEETEQVLNQSEAQLCSEFFLGKRSFRNLIFCKMKGIRN